MMNGSDINAAPLISVKKYKGDAVLCEHPRIILNPLIKDLLYKYGHLHTPSRDFWFKKTSMLFYFFNTCSLSAHRVDYDSYEDYQIIDDSTGECFPVYLLVPCNHCELCEKSKLDAFAHRCVLESQCYNVLPWFLTLTYNDAHRPADGVSVSHVQKFLKRLRIKLERLGYSRHIRYVCVAEYSPVGRPHYHLILWNLTPFKQINKQVQVYIRYHKLIRIIQAAWSHGFVYNEIVSPKHSSKDGKSFKSPEKCFQYVSKYLGKGSNIPDGCNPTFRLCSNRGGGIGSPFLKKYVIPTIRHTLNKDFKYLNIWSDGNVENIYFNRYILNKCFPTFSQSVPYKFRKAWRELVIDHSILPRYRQAEYEALHNTISQHICVPGLSCELLEKYMNIPAACLFSCPMSRWRFDSNIKLIQEMLPHVDFAQASLINDKRKLFVSKMLQNHKKRDLSDILYKFRIYKHQRDERVFLPM